MCHRSKFSLVHFLNCAWFYKGPGKALVDTLPKQEFETSRASSPLGAVVESGGCNFPDDNGCEGGDWAGAGAKDPGSRFSLSPFQFVDQQVTGVNSVF